MDIRIRICREPAAWSVSFPPCRCTLEFGELAEALEHAKKECGAAPALIELFSDGMYIGVSQDAGWPHRLCVPARPAGRGAALSARVADIGRGLRRRAERLSAWCQRGLAAGSRGSRLGARLRAGRLPQG
jgi:hypothetical protein